MLESFQIRNIATYDSTGISCDNLAKVNFIYGANGSGKTTISKLLKNPQPSCTTKWLDNRPLDTHVYNKYFKDRNISSTSFEGVFTIGEENVDNENLIIEKKKDRENLLSIIRGCTTTLDSKKEDLALLDTDSIEKIWNNSSLLKNDSLRITLTGFLSDKRAFFRKNLIELGSNIPLLTLDELEQSAKSIFHSDPSNISVINSIPIQVLKTIEKEPIWKEIIIGKSNIDISDLIESLNISDWVNAGVEYIQKDEDTCPFCQKDTIDSNFRASIENYFDTSYRDKSYSINSLITNYKSEVIFINRLLDQIINFHEEPLPYNFDLNLFKQTTAQIKTKFELNINIMQEKSQELSCIIDIKDTSSEVTKLQEIIESSNIAIQAHNNLVATLNTSKENLKKQAWRYTTASNKEILDNYKLVNIGLNRAINGISSKISNTNTNIIKIDREILELSEMETNTETTVNEINTSLASFGFTGFHIKNIEQNRYQLQRSDGSLAKDTLSEGEVTFITFLYFYHICKGGTTENTINTDRIIIIDDPISSLDSNILFVVSSLVKDIIQSVKSDINHQIKQLIVLTHNVYFHKEVSFVSGQAQSENSVNFWNLRKINNITNIISYENKNPICSSYELLWRELEEGKDSRIAVQNSMRRIIENYFKILGGMGDNDILNKFECRNEQLICRSLICWVNDGSHCIPDDLYIDGQYSSIEEYTRVFEAVFEKTGHIAHYNMMMKDRDEGIPNSV